MKTRSFITLCIGEPEVLAQLAEEAAELSQAALKLRRAITGKNPTPKSENDCRFDLLSEAADVFVCIRELGFLFEDSPIAYRNIFNRVVADKTARWCNRIMEEQLKSGGGGSEK